MISLNNRIALLEFGTSHVECMYSQLAFFENSGFEVHQITRATFRERYRYYQNAAHYHWLPDQSPEASLYHVSRQISQYIRHNDIGTVVINTYSGTILKWLLPQLMGLNILGIVHDLKKFEKSLFRKYMALNVRDFWVLNDHLLQFTPNNFGLKFESFYPVFYPEFPLIDLSKPEEEFWICIPGQVELKRKNFNLIFQEDLKNLDPRIKFILLGPAFHAHGSGERINELINKVDRERFKTFNGFIDDRTFHSYLAKCDLFMPLISGIDRYLNGAISGTYNLSFGYQTPMLIESNALQISDLAEYALDYNAGSLVTTLNNLVQNRPLLEMASKKISDSVKLSFDYQSKRYLRRILSLQNAKKKQIKSSRLVRSHV